MARDSYNQSIGNPLQSDRLPNSWPTIEVPCRPSGGLEAIAVILCWGVFMFASSMLAWLVIRREHSLPAPPFLVVGIVVGAIVFLMGGTPNQQSGEHGLFLRFTARLEEILSRICMGITLVSALFAITVFRELPSIIQQLLASIALGSLIRAFGRHYAGFCTTSPQRRQKAWDVRRDCDWALRGIAIWPTIAICLGNAYGVFWDVATVTVIIVAIATAILASSRPTDAFTAPGRRSSNGVHTIYATCVCRASISDRQDLGCDAFHSLLFAVSSSRPVLPHQSGARLTMLRQCWTPQTY